jgi:hypothetical protein
MRNLLLTTALLFITLLCYSQAPQAFNYQGVLRDLSGNTINNSNVSVRFSIQDGYAGGPIEYQEVHPASTNSFGIITLSVGTGTPTVGTFSTITWSNGPKFLQVEFDPAGGTNYTLLGSSQILSVPYALYAGSVGSGASQWIDGSNNTIHYPSGRVGIGVSYPTAGLDVQRNDPDSLGVIALGRFTSNDPSGGVAYDDGAFVEMKTNDLRGTLSLGGTQLGANNNIGTLLHTTGGWQWNRQLNIMGNMGVGFNSPLHRLQVNGNISFTSRGQKLIFASTPTDSLIFLSRPIGTDGILINANDVYIRSIVTPVQLQTSNTVVVTDLNSIGKFTMDVQTNRMGIGTVTPSSSLTVESGDVEIKDINSGVILRSPNGNCWRVTIDNSGNLLRTAISCP